MSTQFSSLNQNQQKAVLHGDGPAIVLAGAGSGKTSVLTSRVARLIGEKIALPHQIVVVTFTNKAAGEIRERIYQKTGQHLPLSGTFHSICARILRQHGHHIGLNNSYTIYDSADQKQLFKQVFTELNLDKNQYNPAAVAGAISNAKNELISYQKYTDMAKGQFQQIVAKVYARYQTSLRNAQAVDFDDLLLLGFKLLSSIPEVRELYQSRLTHVLIDEYQDTNKVQYELSKIFAEPQNNLYVVGDFSQSIYAWRGADYRNMLQLQTDFQNITEYRLEQNYRSNQNILDAATQVISHNTSHPILELWTNQSAGNRIVLFEHSSSRAEAEQVALTIQRMSKDISLDSMAILYRTNAQSREFEEAFIAAGIPYQLIGGTKFYERKEIKDVISYLRYALNRNDTVSYERILKLGKRRLDIFEQWLTKLDEDTIIQANPAAILKQLLDISDYLNKYDRKTEENLQRLANVEELINVAAQFDTVVAFLENIALIQNDYLLDAQTAENTKNASVSLMSFHAAKGLEFEIVFMVGMEEGLFPHSRAFIDPDQLEEERRLCYVGITRAKQHLFLSFARSRFQYGRVVQSLKSRFLNDIDDSLLDMRSDGMVSNSIGWNGKSPAKKSSAQSSARRYVPIDDDLMEGILSGERSLEDLINQ
ncbi:MAG: UvrD-helicase domain-containing protein [Microgenomates group bacterium]